jgi:hypothetical protein
LIGCLFLGLISCKKGDDGLAGPPGRPGPVGPIGAEGAVGNANVIQYNFNGYNFTSAGFSSINLQVTTTADTMNRSAWNVYLVRASGNVYPVPGWGLSGDSEYRVLIYYSGGKANITITKDRGPGEDYANIRVIRIYANTVVPGERPKPSPGVDPGDYEARSQVLRIYVLKRL